MFIYSKKRCNIGILPTSFEKWADNRPSCVKHMGNLMHFSCKCPAWKRYKTWEATIGGAVWSRRFTKLLRASWQRRWWCWSKRHSREKHHFVSPRKVIPVLDSDALRYLRFIYNTKKVKFFFFSLYKRIFVVVMPRTILPRRNRRCALSATGTWKPEEKDARSVTCFMEENEISLCEVVRFDEYKRD